MSILRLSCDRSTLYAPTPEGHLIDTPFDGRTGVLDTVRERDQAPDLADDTAPLTKYLNASLPPKIAALAPDQPIVVMVHGFLFDPHHVLTRNPRDSDNAHARLYHFSDSGENDEIRDHTTGWPLWLGFNPNEDDGSTGLGIAFGWHSKPGLAASLLERFQNFYARAYDYGTETAWALVNVLNRLALHPGLAGRRIDIFCHSLGSHVITRAIALGCKHAASLAFLPRLGRVVFLGGAEYVVEAQLMYRRLLQAGLAQDEGPTFYNVGCRENDVLDLLGENFGPRTFGNTNVLGHNGLDLGRAERWIDLQIDSGDLRAWLKSYDGLDISGDQPGNVWDHWYYYTHRGNMMWYQRIFRDRRRWDIPALRRRRAKLGAVPEGISRGWFGD